MPAALWLAGLWYVAPLLSRSRDDSTDAADRIRDAIVLGCAIPLVLAALTILTASACTALLCLLIVVRSVRRPPQFRFEKRFAVTRDAICSRIGEALPLFVIVATAWPVLVRPIMQGDSIGYHLPDAAAWTATHSLYTTGTPYWWYPGGSELFAAGLLAVAGPLAVGFAGLAASLQIAYRLHTFARAAGLGDLASGCAIAAFVSVPIIALQGASLENDVWLAAWLLDIVWTMSHDRASLPRSIAICALVKPYGWLFALIPLAAGRAPWRAVSWGFAPFMLWVARDAALWRGALIDPARLAVPNLFATTIAGNGIAAFAMLGFVIVKSGVGTTALAIACVATIVFSRDMLLRATAFGTALSFIVEPFSFRNDLPQLASGASLRFAFPAFALGFAGTLPWIARTAPWSAIAFAILSIVQLRTVDAIFAHDPATAGAVLVAIAISLGSLLPRRNPFRAGFAAICCGYVAYGLQYTAAHPLDYYDDAVAHAGKKSTLYTWLARERPRAAAGYSMRVGPIVVASPATIVYDPLGDTACAFAKRVGAVLVVAGNRTMTDAELARRIAYGRACGEVVFEDGSASVVRPK